MYGRVGDLVFFQFTIQAAAADSQARGRLFFIPIALLKGIKEQSFLILQNGSVLSRRS